MIMQVLEQQFSVCKVADYGEMDCCQPFVFTGSTDTEKSLVCPTECISVTTLERVDGWRAFRIEGQLDFSLIGILASISSVLAAEKSVSSPSRPLIRTTFWSRKTILIAHSLHSPEPDMRFHSLDGMRNPHHVQHRQEAQHASNVGRNL